MSAAPPSLRPGIAVAVRSPASSANLGPGFDSVGLALGVWDDLEFTVTDAPGLLIEVAGSGADGVPRDESHLVYRSLLAGLRRLGVTPPAGLVLRTRNAVPHGRGMGSSATAIVAGVAAAYGLVARAAAPDLPAGADLPIDRPAVSALASELEGHPDNASAAVFGGMTLSWLDDDTGDPVTIGLPLHPQLTAVVFVPEATLATHTARALLPERVPLREAAFNTARGALLVEAATRRPELLVAATRDWLHQEPRRPSYAASMGLVDRLRAAGHAAAISGAGPSVLVLTTGDRVEQVIAEGDSGPWQRLVPGIPPRGVGVLAR